MRSRCELKILALAACLTLFPAQGFPEPAAEPKKKPEQAASKADEREEGFLLRLGKGILPPDGKPYLQAPSTPMRLKLHRPEPFGIHLHNVGFRYSAQPDLTTATGKNNNQFQTPAAELEFSGSIMPKVLFAQVVIEPRNLLGKGLGDSLAGKIDSANEPSGIVRDAFFDVLVDEALVIRAGQQRVPFGIETQNPGGLLPFVNRAFIDTKVAHNAGAQGAAFGDAELLQERDVGVQLRGNVSPYFNYALGGFNGSGINVSDTNNDKDFSARLGVVPNPGARFGVSGYKGTATNLLKQNVSRDRVGLDFEILPELLPRFRIVGEAVVGKDGSFDRKAWYVSGFYELIPHDSPSSSSLWLAARYDEMRDDDRFSRTTLGLTYYILNAVHPISGYWQQVKLQLNYEMRHHRDGLQTDTWTKNLLIAQLTARF